MLSVWAHAYAIREKLRELAYVDLYSAERRSDGAAVLLKVPGDNRNAAIAVARLRHEYAILRVLEGGEGVIRALGLEEAGNSCALVLENLGDATLDREMPGRRWELGLFLETAVAMARAVETIHRQLVIHKDLKPHHFVRRRGDKKITLVGFGIATRLSREERQPLGVGQLEGTLAYMAPEQTGRVNRVTDRRTDLYSLGVAFYELLTGSLPFPSGDPLELVHSHIARTPRAPDELCGDIPPVLSQIIMKLLSKVAEDRYQDVGGLRADLERCLRARETTGQIVPFTLGEHDFSDELRVPQRLYGRERELGELRDAFARVRRGAPELLLISGPSGVGKSALVHELERELAPAGRLVMGKFDLLGRAVPYAPIVQVSTALVRSLLTERAEVLASWRERVVEALGPNARVVIDLVPELELVVGPNPAVSDLPAADAQHRFELVFQSFLRVFATEEHPLLVFLDDLQWADAASLRLIQLLLTSTRAAHLLVIGAFREQEVDAVHPLALALTELRKAGVAMKEIALAPLEPRQIARLIAETCRGSSDEEVGELAAVARRKTLGNPFFLGQFLSGLHRDGLLWFDRDARRWTWDRTRITEVDVSDNVVDFMVGRLRRLPEETQVLLQLAACIGHRFDRATLAAVTGRRPDAIEEALWPAARAGLVVVLANGVAGPQYRFEHDRVQQSAYALVEPAKMPAIHLRIGRLMKGSRDSRRHDEFAIAHQLNLGAALIVEREERLALAQMDLSLAQRARQAAAYGTALDLLAACFALLGDEPWTEPTYDLAYASQLACAECQYLGGRPEEALRLLEDLGARARRLLEEVAALSLRTTILTTTSRGAEAVACGLQTAMRLGASFPPSAGAYGPAIGAEIGALEATLAGRSADAFLELPEMTDPESMALADTFYATTASAGQTNPELMVLIILKAVNLFLRKGNASVSPYFYACYGLVLSVQGRYEVAYQLGQIGLALAPRSNSKAVEAATGFVFSGFISFWRAPLWESVRHFQRAQRIALEAGNHMYTAYCMSFQILHRLLAGESLDQLAVDLPEFDDFVARTGDLVNSPPLAIVRRLIANLKDEPVAGPGGALGGVGFDTAEIERVVNASHNNFLIDSHYLCRVMSHYLADELAESARLIALTSRTFTSNFLGPEATFWRPIASIAAVDRTDPEKRRAVVEAARGDIEQLRLWAESSPETFGHRHALAAAELASLEGDPQALALYEKAVAASEASSSLLHEALANELTARHLTRHGRAKLAAFYLDSARAAYERWGATRKVRALSQRRRAATEGAPGEATLRSGDLDTLAVMRASQAISTEIVLPKLVERLMAIVIEQAGAERGALLLRRAGKLASVTTTGPSVDELPGSVVDYVERTQETVLLGDAARSNIFAADPYFETHGPRSLLCLPLVRQGQLVGILYLENRLTGGAFTHEHVALLGVLSAQAAISLENAALYESVEARVAERTRELAASLEALKSNQAQLIEAERRAAVARYESEMSIAQKIQTSLVPRELPLPGYELAAGMVTASEVGGDYYDVVPIEGGGFWLGVGDVSGHGLNAGLMMLMIQSGLAALMRRDASSDPVRLVCLLNEALVENVRRRLGTNDFATLSVLKFFADGRFELAGAHEEMLVWRAGTGRVEHIPTPGTWVGITEKIEPYTVLSAHRLEEGDVMVLYTDGIIEAGVKEGAPFGYEGLERILASSAGKPVRALRDEMFEAVTKHAPVLSDDRTLLVLRRRG